MMGRRCLFFSINFLLSLLIILIFYIVFSLSLAHIGCISLSYPISWQKNNIIIIIYKRKCKCCLKKDIFLVVVVVKKDILLVVVVVVVVVVYAGDNKTHTPLKFPICWKKALVIICYAAAAVII